MSSIRITLLFIFMVLILALAGCSDKNDKAVFDSVASGGHPAGWIKSHKASALADIDACVKCHGETLTGGVSSVSCLSTPMAIRNGFACHAANPIVNSNCTSCHSTPPNGNAAPNRTGAHTKHLALSGITCDTCHSGAGAGTANHAKASAGGSIASATVSQFASSYQAKGVSTFGYNAPPASNCSGITCHGGLTTPSWNSGTVDCSSCHGYPPATGAHTKHLALTGVTCNYCHNGAGDGTTLHYNGTADVSLMPKLAAKAGTLGYNSSAASCSAVICHGGQATPVWSSGTIAVATDCLKCHEQGVSSQSPQYNSFFSGTVFFGANLHKIHLLFNVPSTTTPVVCTDCHNSTVLAAKHFADFTTSAFESAASGTIGGGSTKITNYVPYTATIPSGSCTSACHATIGNNPRNWIGSPRP